MNTKLIAHDIFWLARYAHNTLAPLLKSARNYEPSSTFSVQMNFDHPDAPYFKYHHLEIYVRAEGQRNTILTSEHAATTTAQIDAVATKVRDFIQTEQAAFEVLEDAKAEAATLAAAEEARIESMEQWHDLTEEAEADADYDDLGYEVSDEDMEDYEAQQERIQERADIERAEHDHDIHLQNEMAGN